jgi:hypothetical protein
VGTDVLGNDSLPNDILSQNISCPGIMSFYGYFWMT